MSASSDDDPPEVVGYGKPPKSGQFRKGQSGNPRGRPRKRRQALDLVAARYPTREALRAVAEKTIAVTDASGRHEVTNREAVTQALFLNALRGGVLAQRTALELLAAEDERLHREKAEHFSFWQAYQARARASIEEARRAGKPEQEPLPHPDDIEFDWRTLDVRFLGALDEEAQARERQLLVFRDLCLEMVAYTREENWLPQPGEQGSRFGFYLAHYLLAQISLPPRLQACASLPTVNTCRREWGKDLERRCRQVGLRFVKWRPGLQLPAVILSKAGGQWSVKPAPLQPTSETPNQTIASQPRPSDTQRSKRSRRA